MKSNADLFKFIDELVSDLREEEEIDRAKKIESAFYISTVPGEILGQLRIELNDLLRSEMSSVIRGRNRIVEAVQYLNRILG